MTDIHCDVYHLQRSLGKLPCDEEMEEHLHQEILDSIKEHLWHKWVPALPGEELSWHPAGTPRHNPQANYSTRNCATYDRFNDMKWCSCEEALAVVRDNQQQALVAAALLEDKIEKLSCSLSQSPMLRKPWACRQPLAKIPDCKSSNQSPPGGIMPRGANKKTSPVL